MRYETSTFTRALWLSDKRTCLGCRGAGDSPRRNEVTGRMQEDHGATGLDRCPMASVQAPSMHLLGPNPGEQPGPEQTGINTRTRSDADDDGLARLNAHGR